jgi:beta-glucanase (GH16 family)
MDLPHARGDCAAVTWDIMAVSSNLGIQVVRVHIVAVTVLIGWIGLGCLGRAEAQGTGGLPPRLDRTALHPTFAEDFKHFAASATGLVQGRPAWQTRFIHGERTLANNHEAEWYQDDGPDGPFRVTGNGLDIAAEPKAGLPGGMAYQSGLITSQHLFHQRYGYFEIRAQLPHGRGLWPAFWLLPVDGSWPPEIDVMEMLGGAPETYYVALHARPNGQPLDEVTAVAAPDLTAGFHLFGVSWRPDRISFYLDNVLVHSATTSADLHQPMYLLINLAVGGAGAWPGQAAPTQSGVYHIAWIRVWQFNDLDAAHH